MVNNELVKHIETEQGKGSSKEEIQAYLKQWDYSQNEIDNSLKYIEFKKAHNLETKPDIRSFHDNKNNNSVISVLGILIIAILLSTGTFFFLGNDEPIERYAPEENISEILEPELFQLSKIDSTVYLNKDESKRFFLENEEHTITLDAIGENYADITLESDPIKITLFVAQEIPVDINGDNINDLSFRLVFTDKERVSFKIKELEQPEQPEQSQLSENETCNVDADCDDDLINTIDSCKWVGDVKECSNVIRDACETNSDCDYKENQTGKCVKSSIIPYCEFYEPDECKNDSDCDDKDSLTIDTCLNFDSRSNRCMHETVDQSKCGDVDKIKYLDGGKDSSYSKSKSLICLGKDIVNGIDAEIKYKNNETDEEIKLDINVDDDNDYELKIEFEDFKDELKFLDGESIKCNFDEDEMFEIACKDENCSKLDDSEIGNKIFTYLLENLKDTPYVLREYCEGDLFDDLDPIPTWKLKGEDCDYDEDCFEDELETCSKSHYMVYSSPTNKAIYQIEGLSNNDCLINLTYLKSNLTEGMSVLCEVPKNITEIGKFDILNTWFDKGILNCTGSLKDLFVLMEEFKKCTNNNDCEILYTNNQIISINKNFVLDYKILYKDIDFLKKSYNGKNYTGNCKTTGICDKSII